MLIPRAGPTNAAIKSPVIEVIPAREIEPMPVAGPITLRPSAVRYDGLSVRAEEFAVEVDSHLEARVGGDDVHGTSRGAAARPIGDRPLSAAALAVLARALAWGGAAQPGEAVRSEAAALIDLLSDDELARRLDAAVNLAGAEIYLDRFIDASPQCRAGGGRGSRNREGQLFPGVFATLGVAWCAVGRLVEAAELLDAAIEAARLSGNTQALAWVLFCRSFVAVPSGDAEIAVAAAEESLDLTRDVGGSVIAARAALMLAVALPQTGQPARAAEVLASSAAGEQSRWCLTSGGLRATADDQLLD